MPSTVIQSYFYDPRDLELTIIFQTRRSYTYLRVPAAIHTGMKDAFSKGEFFNEHIRGKFAFRKNADVPPLK